MSLKLSSQRRFASSIDLTPVILAFVIMASTITGSAGKTKIGDCLSYDNSDKVDDNPALSSLLGDIPSGWEVRACPAGEPKEFLAASPIYHSAGVSYFRLYLLHPDIAENGAEAENGAGYDPAASFVMMKLNPSGNDLSRLDEGFVETQSITIDTFKNIIGIWEKVFTAPTNRIPIAYLSDVDKANRDAMTTMFADAKKLREWKVSAAEFEEDDSPGSPPHYSALIEVGNKWWDISFDFAGSNKITVLAAGQIIE